MPLWVLGAWAVSATRPAAALTLEDLGTREWRVREVVISGNETFSAAELRAEVLTPVRSWYTPWKRRPVFDPVTFEKDLERLRRFHESRGFYDARVVYDLEIEAEDLLGVHFWVEEHEPVRVARVEAGVKGRPDLPLPEKLPIRAGQRFGEDRYQRGSKALLEFFLDRGFAHVEVERSAKVDREKREAEVRYVVDVGPESVFGDTRIEGLDRVQGSVVLAELGYLPGDRFALGPLAETRENLLRLDLFASVDIGWEHAGKPWLLPMVVKAEEKPPREISASVGYATDERYRTEVRWSHHDWLGGARELTLTGKYSAITSSVGALFAQPHFPAHSMRSLLEFRQQRDDEDNYLLNASRLLPRIEQRFTRTLGGSLGFRVELDQLKDVDEATVDALGGVRRGRWLSGPTAGVTWNTASDPLDPKRGEIVSLVVDEAGTPWGGDFEFWKTTAEARKYFPLFARSVVAARVKLAFAEAIGDERNLPIFERLYAGGEKSVRGYGRRRLGPRSSGNDPIGGRSLVEGAVEIRRPIWHALGAALFLDAGQVSLDRFDPPVGDLRYGTGFGLYYKTPVGPLRLDLGFPFERPPGDPGWQLYFSIGQFF